MTKRVCASLLVWLTALGLAAQPQPAHPTALSDTIHLDEIPVLGRLPLNDAQTIDFFRLHHFATIDQLAARLPSVHLIRRGNYALEPQINGLSGGQINLTIDGMHIFGACTDRMDPASSYVEPTNLESIEVQPGALASESGCTVGGNINMRLRSPQHSQHTRWNGRLGLGFEQASMGRNVLASVARQSHKWSVLLDGVWRRNENYRAANDSLIRFSQFGKLNLHAALSYRPTPKHRFGFDYLFDLANQVGYPALTMDVATARASIFALEHHYHGLATIQSKLYYNRVYHLMDDSQRDSLYRLPKAPVGKSDTVFMRMDMPGFSNTLGAYTKLSFGPWPRHRIDLKLEHYTHWALAEMTMYMRYANSTPEKPMYLQTWPETTRSVTGAGATWQWLPGRDWQLETRLRFDYAVDRLLSDFGKDQFSVFGYQLARQTEFPVANLGVHLRYQPTGELQLAAAIGYGQRLPSLTERFGYYLYNAYDGFDYIGNPEIAPETSYTAEWSLQYTHARWQLSWQNTAYQLRNHIQAWTQPQVPAMNFYAQGTRVFQHQGLVYLLGSQLQVMYRPSARVSVLAQSKFNFGATRSGDALPMIAPLHNLLALQYRYRKLVWQGEVEHSAAQNRIQPAYGEQPTPAFVLLHSKLSYEFAYAQLHYQFSLGLRNATDRAYFEHLDWGRILRPGRSIDLFLGLRF